MRVHASRSPPRRPREWSYRVTSASSAVTPGNRDHEVCSVLVDRGGLCGSRCGLRRGLRRRPAVPPEAQRVSWREQRTRCDVNIADGLLCSFLGRHISVSCFTKLRYSHSDAFCGEDHECSLDLICNPWVLWKRFTHSISLIQRSGKFFEVLHKVLGGSKCGVIEVWWTLASLKVSVGVGWNR